MESGGVLPRHAYSANDMISGYKVLECRIRQKHDWSQCFYAHPQERARRRSLQRYSYAAVLCPDMVNSGSCRLGDACEKSHSVFEFWLHPDKYCTRMCYDGAQCKRPFCFFAHGPKELRTVRGSSDTRVRLKASQSAGKPSAPQQQQSLQAAAVAAAPAGARAVPTPAADSRLGRSNSWQAYALPESLASSDSLHDEALSPPKRSKTARTAGDSGSSGSSSAGSTSAGSASCSNGGRDSTSSRSDAGGVTAAAAGTTADAALLQQLQLQLQYETCSRSAQPSADAEVDTDAVWSSVQALLSCLSLEASIGQVSEAGLTGADDQHDALEASAAAAAADACKVQRGPQHKRCLPADGNMPAEDGLPATAGLVEQQHRVQQWQAAIAEAGDSGVHVSNMGGSPWDATAAAAAACTLLPAASAAAGFSPGSILHEGATCNRSSSSNALLVSSGSQQSLTGQSLTQSTAVDPADSVLNDLASLGLFGAVQPRTSSKQQQ